MNRISIISAVESNCWLKIINDRKSPRMRQDKEGYAKVRLKGFRKISIHEIDRPDLITRFKVFNLSERDLYIMNIDFISFYKQKLLFIEALDGFIIFNKDNLKFRPMCESHISFGSEFAVSYGLRKFYGEAMPKIKYSGAITFFLPKDDNSDYFATDPNVTICEM